MSKLKRKDYEELLAPISEELVQMAFWAQETGQRILVLFEGRDTAGKGGAINAIADVLNPRQCRVVALSKPSERERTQWYFQRYVPHLPAKGEIVLFDRSWYNRAGVERVMGFCSEAEAKAFLGAVPGFEKALADDGILIFKYWLCLRPGEAGGAVRGAAGGSAEALEAVADRYRGAGEIWRLYKGSRGDAESDPH